MYYPLSVSIHEILRKVSKEEQKRNPIFIKKASRLKKLLLKLQSQQAQSKRSLNHA